MAVSGVRRPLEGLLNIKVVCIVLLVVIVSRPILAQGIDDYGESQCNELEEEAEGAPEPELIEWNAMSGMFFPLSISRLILCELNELKFRRRMATLDQQLMDRLQEQIVFTERQLELSQQTRAEYEGVVELAESRAVEAESKLSVWYRSPVFLISVGVVLTVLVGVGAGYLMLSID